MGLLIVGAHPNIARHATQRMKAAVGVNRLIRILVTRSRRLCMLLSNYRVNACSDRWHTSGDFAKRIRHSRTHSDLIRQTYVIGWFSLHPLHPPHTATSAACLQSIQLQTASSNLLSNSTAVCIATSTSLPCSSTQRVPRLAAPRMGCRTDRRGLQSL